MDQELRSLAERLCMGELTPSQFLESLDYLRTARLQHAALDMDRERRCGHPEAVFGEGKPVATLEQIILQLSEAGQRVLVTRVDADKAATLESRFPRARYNPVARTLRLDPDPDDTDMRGHVAVVSAGTSDMGVTEEVVETLDWMGVHATRFDDLGVAGPQRLLEQVPRLRRADAVVVVAGMEGALPSVVGGYVATPVIAVPTSVGYGASLGGIAALLAMLNSCTANVAVVNIDGGFKAGYVAGLIARRAGEGHVSASG